MSTLSTPTLLNGKPIFFLRNETTIHAVLSTDAVFQSEAKETKNVT